MKIAETYCTLGKDPEYKVTDNGTPIAQFTVAVSNDYKPKGSDEWVKRPASWYNCVAFGEKADRVLEELEKGTRIKLTWAKYERRTYKDQEGNYKETNEVVINDYEIQEKRTNE